MRSTTAITLLGVGVLRPVAAFTFTLPPSNGYVKLAQAQYVKGTFDGGMKTYDRGKPCTNSNTEGQNVDAVFVLEDGATLKNVIIGPAQSEGIHCLGSCKVLNGWHAEVCEDAITLKGEKTDAYIIGGGAQGAQDKVVQFDGFGTVTIENFTAHIFGKLSRHCGDCAKAGNRNTILRGVKASNGKVLVGINSDTKDTASIDKKTCGSAVQRVCLDFLTVHPGQDRVQLNTDETPGCDAPKVLPAC